MTTADRISGVLSSSRWPLLISIGTLAAGGVAGWESLNEAKGNAVVAIADHEHRLRDIERDTRTQDALGLLRIEMARLQVSVMSLQQSCEALHDRGFEVTPRPRR